MYEVTILNLKTNEKFVKYFDSLYLLEKFKNKCKHSKNIQITAIFKN